MIHFVYVDPHVLHPNLREVNRVVNKIHHQAIIRVVIGIPNHGRVLMMWEIFVDHRVLFVSWLIHQPRQVKPMNLVI
jgi:hypothetical protein